MNIGTRLLLSAALAVGSTVGAAALGQNTVRDIQAEVGPAAPQALPTAVAEPAGAGARAGTDAGARAGTDADAGAGTDADAGAGTGADAGAGTGADDRAAAVRAELAAAAAAGEISWDAAERVSDELGGYIRGETSVADIA